jgi:hypothetical protein
LDFVMSMNENKRWLKKWRPVSYRCYEQMNVSLSL